MLLRGILATAEIAAFLTSLSIHGLSTGENEALSRAMVATGKTLSFGEGPILDKHSVGGIPGDKTSMLVVPIVAAAGFTIPKTSSRAITSPAWNRRPRGNSLPGKPLNRRNKRSCSQNKRLLSLGRRVGACASR